jgi:hypothetical protein
MPSNDQAPVPKRNRSERATRTGQRGPDRGTARSAPRPARPLPPPGTPLSGAAPTAVPRLDSLVARVLERKPLARACLAGLNVFRFDLCFVTNNWFRVYCGLSLLSVTVCSLA